ncbi:MAG: SDR family oxidoreductase [Gammaproteobacteria bacterium]|nr:SDR family oxidoreductase [Gammaproteobacteria bacterium]
MSKRDNAADRSPDPRRNDRGTQDGPPAQSQAWPGQTSEMRPRPDHGESSYRGAGRLEGRVALITGGDSGIGRAIAIAFAREGCDVAIAYLEEDDDAECTAAWVHDADREALCLRVDLATVEGCRKAVHETVARFGRIDLLVNNAAYQCEQPDFLALTVDQVERTFRTNILATLFVSQAALEQMGEGGVILNTGSVTGLRGNVGLIDYAATKGAIHNFTKSLAEAVAERGIRVNCVAPGPVWTPLIPATLEEEHVARFGAATLWERPAQPAEIAPSYVFLASEEGRYYTGEILAPTGKSTTR